MSTLLRLRPRRRDVGRPTRLPVHTEYTFAHGRCWATHGPSAEHTRQSAGHAR